MENIHRCNSIYRYFFEESLCTMSSEKCTHIDKTFCEYLYVVTTIYNSATEKDYTLKELVVDVARRNYRAWQAWATFKEFLVDCPEFARDTHDSVAEKGFPH
jgi:hypothetical protein